MIITKVRSVIISGIAFILLPLIGFAHLDCNVEYHNCINNITSIDTCMRSRKRVCIDSCYMHGGRTEECYADECEFDAGWERSCRDQIKREEENCRSNLKSCSNNI